MHEFFLNTCIVNEVPCTTYNVRRTHAACYSYSVRRTLYVCTYIYYIVYNIRRSYMMYEVHCTSYYV